MAVASPDPKMDTEAEEGEGSLRPSADLQISGTTQSAAICVGRAIGESIAGGLIGSLFGYGMGVTVHRHGFKGAFADAASTAKSFAVLSGAHSLAVCFLKKLRGKDDEINAGIAGCFTGIALSCPGAPQAMLQSCVTFGAFSWILAKYDKHPVALALPFSMQNAVGRSSETVSQNAIVRSSETVLQPFSLALPQHMVEGFSLFCQSLGKPKRIPQHRA